MAVCRKLEVDVSGGERQWMPDFEGWCDGYLASVGVLCIGERSSVTQLLRIPPTGRLIKVCRIVRSRTDL